MVCVDFLLQLRQRLDMPIVDLLEIVAFEFLSLLHRRFFSFTPFIQGCKKLVSSHQ